VRVIFLGHACHLVEVGGVRILTDPWLVDPVFEGFVEHDPPLAFAPADLPAVDAIALTHGHLDHFNAPTLAALPDKSVPVVHPPVRFTELDANLRRLGFTQLHARDDFEPFELGSARIVPTPSLGVLDECAYLIEGPTGRFWNGADAPQVPAVLEEVAARFAPVDLCALSHNSFDQPALLGLESFKPADHGPRAAAHAARTLEARHAFAAASNMRWCGPAGEEVTRKVIRRRPRHLAAALASDAPGVACPDLAPGDAWSREGGVERAAVSGSSAPRVAHDYIHAFLETGERWCGAQRPSTEEIFRRHLPERMSRAAEASAYAGQPVLIEVVGDDPGVATVDFRKPGALPAAGDAGAPYGLRIRDEDWKDLFERRISWQVLLVSDRLAVTRVEPGPPPRGLHFCFAMQALFP
jgi:L-ascorbate metabolism protein UlaG (beta-lactamase superfamily)